jgi:hypothetical protein
MTIENKVFIPDETHHNLYDPMFEYMDFFIKNHNHEETINRYGKTYKLFLIEHAKLHGYNLFYIYISNGVRIALIVSIISSKSLPYA